MKTTLYCSAAATLLALAGCGRGPEQNAGEATTAQLAADLTATAPETRIRAATQLGLRGDAAAVSPLIDCLDDIRPDVRKAAATALGHVGHSDAVPRLCAVTTASGGDVELKRLAANALAQIADRRAVPSLAQCLDGEDEGLAFSCAYALGQIGEPALDALIHAVEEGGPQAQRAAASVLGQIPGDQTLRTLRGLLTSTDASLRLSAAENLGRLRDTNAVPEIAALLMDPDLTVRRGTPRVLASFGPAAARALGILLAIDANTVEREATDGRNVLVSVGPAHAAAVKLLLRLDGAAIVRPLVIASKSRHGGAAQTAREYLIRQLDQRSCRDELFRLAFEGTPQERERAIGVVASFLRSRRMPPWDTAEKRQAGLTEMGLADIADHLEPMAKALRSRRQDVRLTAALCLCLLSDLRGKEMVLAEALSAADALRGEPRNAKELHSRAASYLSALRPVADAAMADKVAPLLKLGDPKSESYPGGLSGVFASVVSILERGGQPRHAEILIPMLSVSQLRRGVALRVCDALGAMGEKRAFDPMVKYMKGFGNHQYWGNARAQIMRALFQCDRERAYAVVGAATVDARAYDHVVLSGIADLYRRFPDARAVLPLVHWVNHDIGKTQDIFREALVEIGRKDLSWLVDGLDTRDHKKRTALAGVIADGFGADALPAMLKAAEDKRPRIRQGAVWTLGCIGGADAVAAVQKALTDEHPGIRSAAAWSAGRLRVASLSGAMLVLLKDEDAGVRSMAAEQLGATGGVDAVSPLVTALRDRDVKVRAYAAMSLAKLEAVDALTALEDLGPEKDPDVHAAVEYAVRVLRRLRDASTPR